MKKITQKELFKALALHKVWAFGLSGGERLSLSCYDLRGLDFSFNDLSQVDMSGADACGANFVGCELPPDNMMPEMYIGDAWGAEFYGSTERAQQTFKASRGL